MTVETDGNQPPVHHRLEPIVPTLVMFRPHPRPSDQFVCVQSAWEAKPPLFHPAYCLSPALTHSANSFLCVRMSTNPGLVSSTRNGLPTKSFSTSPLLFRNPCSPSRSTLPAHTRHWIGRRFGVPETNPSTVTKSPNTVSMEMSMGRDVDAGVEDKAALVVRSDCSAECSWAE